MNGHLRGRRVEVNSTLPGEWEFEPAEPDVGFLSDTITHLCEKNLDADTFDVQPATEDHTFANVVVDGVTKVADTTLLTCPACGATTSVTDHWPLWMFEEDRSGDD